MLFLIFLFQCRDQKLPHIPSAPVLLFRCDSDNIFRIKNRIFQFHPVWILLQHGTDCSVFFNYIDHILFCPDKIIIIYKCLTVFLENLFPQKSGLSMFCRFQFTVFHPLFLVFLISLIVHCTTASTPRSRCCNIYTAIIGIFLDCTDCLRRNPLTCSGKAQALFCRCLDIDLIGFHAKCLCNIFPHLINIWTHFRTLGNDRRINIFNHISIFIQ